MNYKVFNFYVFFKIYDKSCSWRCVSVVDVLLLIKFKIINKCMLLKEYVIKIVIIYFI